MSVANLVQSFSSDDVSRKIVSMCKNGKTVDEIMNSMFEYYRKEKFITDTEVAHGYVAGRLASLENMKAIEFREGKWFQTEVATTVLEKYFGI